MAGAPGLASRRRDGPVTERQRGGPRPTGVKRPLLRSLGLVSVLFAGLVVLPSAPAWACSCASPTTAGSVGRADVVLRGTLEDVDRSPGLNDPSSGAAAVSYRFAVSEVFRGAASATTWVGSAADGASCGLEGLQPGREYVVFAQEHGEQLWAGLCDGTAIAASGLVADVEAVTGSGHEPVQPGAVGRAAPLPGATSGPNGTAWRVPLVGGGALALVLTGLLVGVVLRGRRRG